MLNSLEDTKDNELPLVSMISVFYNRGYCVEESVKSMIDQTYSNLEIILVDDKSTDNTLQELKKFEYDPRVKVITHPNMGFTRSIKKAIEETANGEYIAVHGSGDISFKRRIEKQYLCLKNKQGFSVCGCLHNNLDITGKKVLDSHTFSFDVVKKIHFLNATPFTHGTAMFKTIDYKCLGGYDDFFEICQDWDLWLRFIKNGYGICYINDLLYSRVEREGSISNSSDVKNFRYGELIRKIHFEGEKGSKLKASFIRKKNSTLTKSEVNIYRHQKSLQAIRLYLSGLDKSYYETIALLRSYGGGLYRFRFFILILRMAVLIGVEKIYVLRILRKLKNLKNFSKKN
ncbi:MAG: glycosyltransferase [Methyloprofundus sp.]|nr:glycosyltransferase [Methyloprofundus sp.]